MLRAWLQPPEPMWKLLNWRRAAGGGGGREERRKGAGDGLLRVASCQPGNSANSWERAVCENFLPCLLPRVPGLDSGPWDVLSIPQEKDTSGGFWESPGDGNGDTWQAPGKANLFSRNPGP